MAEWTEEDLRRIAREEIEKAAVREAERVAAILERGMKAIVSTPRSWLKLDEPKHG